MPLLAITRHVYESDGAKGIQDAINASSAYDTVFVHTGIYYVRDVDSIGITMKDSIRVISPHPESVTLSGLNSTGTDTAYHVIYCKFSNPLSKLALIQGFTITQGKAKGRSPHNCGGGIYCYQSSPTIQNNIIGGNSAIVGGGIYFSDSSPILRHNLICNNSAVLGGGIYWYGQQSFPTTYNNIIKENISKIGGGMYFSKSSPVLKYNLIQNNLAYEEGGGLYSSQCWPTIHSSIISGNLAKFGGGFFCTNRSAPKFQYSVLANNIATKAGGAFYSRGYSQLYIDSCFIVENGAIDSTKSGLLYLPGEYDYSDTVIISHSHLYYNTFQPDCEIDNNTDNGSNHHPIAPVTVLLLENNYWLDTTDAGISSLIEGPNDHTPWEYNLIQGVPGEPVSIDSVRNYNNNYSGIIDSLENDPDTLYLRIYGEDRNAKFIEPAVAIIKTSIYPTGIAVALIETDTNSGIYEGKATIKVTTGNDTIRVDDIYNIIKVDTSCNAITITANMDSTQEFVVWYRCRQGIEEKANPLQGVSLQLMPSPATNKVTLRYTLPGHTSINLHLYDISGRLVKTIWSGQKEQGCHNLIMDIGELPKGIYFVRVSTNAFKYTRKLVVF